MRIIESRSIDNQAGLLGSRLITGTSTIEGAFQSFIVAEDTIVSKVYNSIGIDVTQKLGLTSVTLKAGAFISMAKGDYFSSIKLTSGSVVAYFVSHGGMTITADAYLNEFLARTGSSYLEAAECAKATLQGLINIGLLQKASLVMSPSMYQEDLVKSVVPQDGSGDLSFTRASDGTRVNSAGLVEVVPWNLATNSNNFASGWSLVQSSKSTGFTDPVGNSNAIKLNYTTVSSSHYINQIISLTGSNAHSVYAKAGELQFLQIASAQSTDEYANFNLSTGVIGTYGSLASNVQIENVGNGWYRCSVVLTNGSNGIYCAIVQSASSNWFGVSAYSGANNTDGLYLYGGQVNTGTLKPYFPTTDRLNVPRLTYQNGGGGCPSLLLEPQRTNIFPNSQTTANWSFTNMSRTANYGISPDGTQNADLLSPTTSGSVTFQSDITTSSLVIGQPFVVSFFIKLNASFTSDAGTNILDIRLSGPTVWSRPTVRVNLETGEVTSINNAIYISSTNFGNGWFRITFGATPTGTSGQVALQSPTSVTMNGGSFYIWGLQLEASTYATSYIPTTSSSATRVIDDCRKTGISSLIGQTEGTMFIDLNLTAWDSNSFYFGLYGGGNEIYFRCAGTGAIDFVHYFGATQAFITKSGLSLGRHKLAACYKNNDWAFYVDGILVGTDTSGTFSGTISQMVFGYTSISAYPPFQSVNQTILFPTRLTNAELASLTTI